jgi:hypothetical protein
VARGKGATMPGATPQKATGKEALAAMCPPACSMRFFLRLSEQGAEQWARTPAAPPRVRAEEEGSGRSRGAPANEGASREGNNAE